MMVVDFRTVDDDMADLETELSSVVKKHLEAGPSGPGAISLQKAYCKTSIYESRPELSYIRLFQSFMG